MDFFRLSEGGTVAEFAYTLIVLVMLIGSLLVRRRASAGTLARSAAVWIAIAAVLLIGYAFKDEAAHVYRRVMAELLPSSGLVSAAEVSFRARPDGHFAIAAEVEGTRILFLLDSGATDVVLSPDDARRIGFDLDRLRFDKPYATANGLVRGAPVRLKQVVVGPIALSDVRASVNGAPMRESLLGMSFLARLTSWRVEGDRLTLTP